MSSIDDLNIEGTSIASSEQAGICPDCGENLKKCLIQQNYAMVICPNNKCEYPFNQNEVLSNVVYVDESEVLAVAKKRLSKN